MTLLLLNSKRTSNMGTPQLQNTNTVAPTGSTSNITKSRFIPTAEAAGICRQSRVKIQVQPFKRLTGWELQLQAIAPSIPPESTLLNSEVYFPDLQSMNTYLSHMVALKQICHLNLYDDFEVQSQKSPFCITSRQQLTGIPKALNRSLLKDDVQKFMQLLIYLSSILEKAQNIFIIPEDLVQLNGQFILRGFLHQQCTKKKLIMAYIVWLFEENENFEECLNVDNTLSSFGTLHRYVKEVFYTIKNDRIDDCDLECYFRNLLDKMKYLEGGFDSFHACYRSKRPRYNAATPKEWLLAKRSNEIYFVNIGDGHVCQGRVMRKSKKISVQGMHIMFNSSDFQVCFMLEGTKSMVKTTEFQLDGCFTISDIEIKYKFPFKLRNPLMFARGREVYMLDQMIYRYSIDENKIYQESKKISDSLCLTPSAQFSYMVVRHSIDIFRYGIRIYFSDRYETLMPSGSAEMAQLMENIKIDIKHVQFCCEVFKGVFLMMADKNLWVLDLNFLCFFSYAPLQRVHNYFKGRGSEADNGEFVFQILNQPFHANWLHHQQGHNVHIQDDVLHVIANVTGKLFYLQYKLIFQAGLLYLITYKPLYQQDSPPQIAQQKTLRKESYFNVYNESMPMFRNSAWVHKGSIFLEVTNLRMQTFKNYTQIFMQTQQMSTNIRDIIQQNKKLQQQWSRLQIVLLLYKLWTMMHFLNQNNIAYKNFNLSNLWISAKREMKLVGWSEPQRNWHISDYKDYLLSSFNVITQNNYEKLNDKFLQKHEAEMQAFPVLMEKMHGSIRSKAAQKRVEVEKNLLSIKECLHGQLYRFIENYRSSKFLFSFEYNTPRFSLMNIQESKIKKMNAVLQNHNSHEEYIFKQTDEYAWSERQSCLFIFTASYQMYELKINTEDMKEQTIVFQQYEYLPSNIIDCSFISCEGGLFAFGGISRNSKKKMHYNLNVYHFNRNKLTWEAIAQIDSPRVKPKLVLSESGRNIYVMSGELGVGSDFLETFVFDTVGKKVERLSDLGLENPFRQLTDKHICKVFQLSQQYGIFLMWSVNSVSYQFKVFSSLIAGFEIDFEGKIYLQEGADLPVTSIAFADGALHFLRPYGKYSKITIQGLDNPKLSNKTLYFN